MKIRKVSVDELERVMEIYEAARAYMKENGNPTQWGDDYPPRELIFSDIERGCCYACEEDGEIWGVFYYCREEDPTYQTIYDGAWLNDAPYGVLHRIAVTKHGHGVAAHCFDFCFSDCQNLKLDTHLDNIPMQRALAKNGFVRCGTVYLETGEALLAYQKTKGAV